MGRGGGETGFEMYRAGSWYLENSSNHQMPKFMSSSKRKFFLLRVIINNAVNTIANSLYKIFSNMSICNQQKQFWHGEVNCNKFFFRSYQKRKRENLNRGNIWVWRLIIYLMRRSDVYEHTGGKLSFLPT